MVQCGAVLERENGVDGFRVYLAVTWEDFMIFLVTLRLADFNPRYSTTKANRKFMLPYLHVLRQTEAYHGMNFLRFANDGDALRATRSKQPETFAQQIKRTDPYNKDGTAHECKSELMRFSVEYFMFSKCTRHRAKGLQRTFVNSVISDSNFARRPRVKLTKQRRIKGRCISGKLDSVDKFVLNTPTTRIIPRQLGIVETVRSTGHLAGNVLCLSISEQGVDECQQASPAGANTVQGFASLQLLSNRVLCRWKKQELATEEEGVLYHNETATRTEMDSGDYEAPVSGCYNRLLT
ncbi:hypothetical protein G5I_02977 [Acromyrmex echinatior]|uniref:Uncharacterized protein n=1 Tax=Acromyrmex echinatior TaxID=103372 RepID=F4WBQ7_ACREC|nr:hypothetical protein G5I_02977 [Acromyrmex echinatior]